MCSNLKNYRRFCNLNSDVLNILCDILNKLKRNMNICVSLVITLAAVATHKSYHLLPRLGLVFCLSEWTERDDNTRKS